MSSPSIFPNVSIPAIPTQGSCCLWQIHKKIDGFRKVRFGRNYKCDMGETARGITVIHLTLSSVGHP